MSKATLCHSCAIAAVLALFCTIVQAQKPEILPPPAPAKTPSAPATPMQPAAQMTKQDVEAFFDGFVPIELRRDDIAGAVVMIVKDGQVLFAKGYGYSDVKAKKPVTVDATLFRPGSISKTFTWTAVMQLLEQGKLDLNTRRERLSRLQDSGDLRQADHDEGPDDAYAGVRRNAARTCSWPRRPTCVLYRNTPRRTFPHEIFPPGTTPAYSNYGATLAGYIVQRVSGMPFDDYVEKNILGPLGMKHTTFRQPLPEELKPLMSQGYNLASQPAKDFEFVQAWPAGSLSTTAEDMSHYMIAHLQNGPVQRGARS